MNEKPVLVADDDLVAGNGKLPRQQIALSVDRRRYTGDLNRCSRLEGLLHLIAQSRTQADGERPLWAFRHKLNTHRLARSVGLDYLVDSSGDRDVVSGRAQRA